MIVRLHLNGELLKAVLNRAGYELRAVPTKDGGTVRRWVRASSPSPQADVAQLQRQLAEEHGVKLHLSHRDGVTTLHNVTVPKELRGRGTGEAVLRRLTAHADQYGHTLALTAEDPEGRGSSARLQRWYKRHGFVENHGRRKDYEIQEGMYRRPQTSASRA